MSKEAGGLGFRDLRMFNQALLAKQGWRLIQQPDSLFCRVFKAKYFSGTTFMEAKLGHRPSYAWRSIASARNVLKMGLRWHIGNGRQVRIIDDPWLPVSHPFRCFLAQDVLDNDERVSLLINDATRSWDKDMVHELFSP